jgi:hypothetical protein
MTKKKIILSIILGVLAITFIVLGVLMFNSFPNKELTTIKEDLMLWGCIWSVIIGVVCLLGSIINLFIDD